MKSLLRAAVLCALCVAVLATERFSYYGMRSILPLRLMDGAASASQAFRQLGWVSAFAAFTPLLGGGLAILLRAPLTGAAGAVLMLVGYALLPMSSGAGGLLAGFGFVALGGGLLKPAVYGLCSSELSLRHAALRAALFVVLYGAVNVAALLATAAAGAVSNAASTTPVLVAALVICGLSALLAFGVVGVDLGMRDKRPEAEKADPPAGRALLAVTGLLLLSLPYGLALGLSGDFWEVLIKAGLSASRVGALVSINPMVVTLCSAVLVAVLLLLHFTKARFSMLYLGGAGLAVVALGATPYLAAAGMGATTELTVSVAIVVMAVGESIAGPILFSIAVGYAPRRFAPLVAALWLVSASVPSFLTHMVLGSSHTARTIVLALAAGACLLGGLALLATAHLVVRFLRPPEGNTATAAHTGGGSDTLMSAQ